MEIVPQNYLVIRTINIILSCRIDVAEHFAYKHCKNAHHTLYCDSDYVKVTRH